MFLKKSKRLAIVDMDGKKVDYDTMCSKIKYLSREIYKDINKKENVLIIAENRIEWIYSFFAIWDRYAVPVCIDALSTKEEIEYFLSNANSHTVIVTNQTMKSVEGIKDINIYNLDEIEILEKDDETELNTHSGDDLAVMIYTSGTTGSPKGVMLSHNNIIKEIEAIKYFDVTYDDEQILAILPFHHILPLMSTVLYFFYYENQNSVVLCKKLSSTEILKCLDENNITILSSVPRLYKLFYKSINDKINASRIAKLMYKLAKKVNNKKFSKLIFKKVHKTFGGSLRTIIAGGAKSDPEMIEFFNVLGFTYCEGYGLSETSPVFMGSVPKHYKIGTIGKPVESVSIKVVDGELLVKGPMVMLGYYNNPEKTKEVMTEDGYFKTGDLVSIDEEGYVTIIGRKNAMIVLSNGKNIDPEKLENKLIKEDSDLLKEVGIFGSNDKLAAIVVPNFEYIRSKKIGNISTYVKNVIQLYNKNVHNYEKILNYKIVEEELPKTRVGKLRRFMLPKIFEGAVETKKEEVKEPNNIAYAKLKEYIMDLKKIDYIHPEFSLEVELAMDSLDLVEFRTYIENSFNIKLANDIFITHYNLLLLSELISTNSSGFTESLNKLDEIVKNSKELNLKVGFLPYITRPFMWVLAKLYFRFEVRGKEKIKDKPTIFIANHESFVDAPLLSYAIPFKMRKNTFFLAILKYFKSPFMKFVANNSNVITVDIEKNIKESIEKLAGVLKSGKNVFVFPEGSRTMDGNLQEFKKVFAILSKELDVDVRCIGINGAYEAYDRFSYFPKPKKITVDVLDEVSPKDKSYEQIVDECYNIFEKYKEDMNK
ncbi:AMP-binding protein [Oceanivirga miroungae]|uniref:2,3-dihydroxybenzoate-AMP ligase component of enterobactin synthase multienzyme complex n=1 Tax=Oceanivirga miroungae TaxID=1130046 RepID=A0A6I8M837_9FUSO|nr:AMP-binding protein [Oceanivirga miroungae]VWL85599.1 2,3-dihydroxybenzoate-AMP ligase component of enterobactin synthase multienzyme complex [Oceanivirga miroungae]